jgi:hypothetical protein
MGKITYLWLNSTYENLVTREIISLDQKRICWLVLNLKILKYKQQTEQIHQIKQNKLI